MVYYIYIIINNDTCLISKAHEQCSLTVHWTVSYKFIFIQQLVNKF